MDFESLVPSHKSDVEAIRRAEAFGYPAIEPILGNLLEWMQDMNWPVAPHVQELLSRIGAPLAPHVLKVIQGNDDVWKY